MGVSNRDPTTPSVKSVKHPQRSLHCAQTEIRKSESGKLELGIDNSETGINYDRHGNI